jgi:hypothetical protein
MNYDRTLIAPPIVLHIRKVGSNGKTGRGRTSSMRSYASWSARVLLTQQRQCRRTQFASPRQQTAPRARLQNSPG